MTKAGILSLPAGLLIFASISFLCTASAADDPTLRQRVDQLAQPYIDNKSVVGMTIGVLRDGKQDVFGYGRMSHTDSRAPDGNTIYEIGGLCKVFTGILLADSVIQGHVRLDQPAEELLPVGVKIQAKGNRAITLRDLSTHVSGLPRIPDNMKFTDLQNPYANYSENDLYAFLKSHRLKREPGTKNSYSNLGVGLLGHLLSLRENSSYEDLVRDRITTPLGMSSTKVTLDQEMQARLAQGYRDGKPMRTWDVRTLLGAGSLRSSVNDMLLFATANLAPREDRLGQAMEMAWTVHQLPIEKRDPAMGLGWHFMRDETHWHNGQTGGYHSMILVDRKSKSSVVLLANTATDKLDGLAIDIARMLSGATVTKPKIEKPITVAADGLQRYVGNYQLERDGVLNVDEIEGKLMISLGGRPAIEFVASTEIIWYSHSTRAVILFNVDLKGQCDSLILFQNEEKQTAKRIPDTKRQQSQSAPQPELSPQPTTPPQIGQRTDDVLDGTTTIETGLGAVLIAIVVFAFAIYHTSTAWFAHRERMAMIERGLDPDSGQSVQNESRK